MNCLALEQPGGILIVDCGSGFPSDDLGVDVIHPDFTWLEQRADRVCGVVLTHGHEDHIGALPYLLADLDVPVWGPPHALALARRRLDDHGFAEHELDLHATAPRTPFELGPFLVEPIRVAHSITDATALAIETVAGTLVHSGDFNLDPRPPDGEPTDEARLAELGRAGVGLLLSDSTNIDVPEPTGSESDVARVLYELVRGAPGRVVITLFASNVQRLISLGRVARETGRKICLLGRSLQANVEIASRLGRIDWPSDLVVPSEHAGDHPPERLLVLAGGTQAERNSALRRLSLAEHPDLSLGPGDRVVMSSRVIPGNERPVMDMVCDLMRLGCDVRTRATDPGAHTSGHATRREQTRMIELVQPRAFLPVHGTLHHLRRHSELARGLGVGSSVVVEDGTVAVFDGSALAVGSDVAHGKVRIALGGERIADDCLRERADLGRSGLVVVSLALDERGGVVHGPRATSLGVPRLAEEPNVALEIEREVRRLCERTRRAGRDFDDEVRRTVRRVVQRHTGTRPTVEIHRLEGER